MDAFFKGRAQLVLMGKRKVKIVRPAGMAGEEKRACSPRSINFASSTASERTARRLSSASAEMKL